MKSGSLWASDARRTALFLLGVVVVLLVAAVSSPAFAHDDGGHDEPVHAAGAKAHDAEGMVHEQEHESGLGSRFLSSVGGLLDSAGNFIGGLFSGPAQAQSLTGSATIDWSTVAPQAFGNSEGQGEVVGGKLYTFGGFDATKGCCTPTARAYVYDPAVNRWTAVKSMPAQNGTGRGGVTHAGFATDGGDIYWAGGYTSNAAGTGQIFGTKEVWKYDVSSNSYSRLPDLPKTLESGAYNRHAAGQMEYAGGKLHFIGGTSADRRKDVGHHFVLDLSNLAAGWKPLAPLPNPRHHAGSAVLSGKIYYIGGQKGHDASLVPQDDVHAYDPATNTWTQVKDLPKARNHASSSTFAMDGRIVMAGGQVNHNTSLADVTAYDPATDAWTELTPLPVRRHSGMAGAINGTIYFTTGSNTKTTYKGVPEGTSPAVAPTIRVNFQPEGSAVPSGYAKDSGLPYDAARGSGWVRPGTQEPVDMTKNTRERTSPSDQRLRTLVLMQGTGVATQPNRGSWEYAVPNGAYEVTASVGDSAFFDGTDGVDVEGEAVIPVFQRSTAEAHRSGSGTVTVSDGRLTVQATGTNTKLNFIDIVPQAAP